MSRYQDLILRARNGETILLDGATGTECERRGVPQLKHAWNGGAALSHPEILLDVHKDYIRSGSEIIITNTFANTKHALEDAGQLENFEKYNIEGVRIAIEARKQLSKNALVAGGVSYWTWTGRKPSFKELSSSIETQANIMKNMGVDFLILEMMVDMEQMITTLDAVKKTKMPIWVGLTCSIDDKGGIYLGESVEAAIENGESLEKAAIAYGASKWYLLRKVDLPLATPSILAGVNQTVMLSLAMVVVASLIGAKGLGQDVLEALQYANVGQGILAGVAILFVALILDRVVQGRKRV